MNNNDELKDLQEKIDKLNEKNEKKSAKKDVKKEDKKDKEIKKLQDEIDTLKKELQDKDEKVLRNTAELMNFKRRKEQETANLLKYANEDFIIELLPVIDNFERAIKLDDTNLNDELSKFLEGFKMIYTHLIEILKKFEVIEIECLNKEFDHNVCQALMTTKVEGVEPGIVVEVLQKGYMLKDKMIRPALVKVSE